METSLEMERDFLHANHITLNLSGSQPTASTHLDPLPSLPDPLPTPFNWPTYITDLFSNNSYGEYNSFEEWHKDKVHELQHRIMEDYEEFGDYDEHSEEIEDIWVEECAYELGQILGLRVLDVGSE